MDGLEEPASPLASAAKTLSFTESNLQWITNRELFSWTPADNEGGYEIFRSWHVKTIAADGKTPITANEVLKPCLSVGCQCVQDAESAVE